MRAILVLMLIWISSCQILEDLKGAIKNGIKINDQTRIHFGNSNRPHNMPGPGFPAAERKSGISQIKTPNTLWGVSGRSRGQECMWEPSGSFDDKVFCVFDKLMLMLGSL